MRRARLFVVIFLIGLTVLLALSCGGGGSSGTATNTDTSTGSGQSPATIDQTSAEKALALATAVGNVADSSAMVTENFGSSANVQGGGGNINIVKPVLDIILNPDFGFQSLGSASYDYDCDSGSGSISMSWTGDDSTSDCHDASDMSGIFIFDNCVVDGVQLKGQISFVSSGSSCEPDSITVTYTDFVAENPDEGVTVSAASFTIAISDFEYSGSGDLVGMTMLMNGSIEITVDGQVYNVGCSDYSMKMVVDGSESRIEVNGAINGSCLDGWVTVETTETIAIRDGDECPYAGRIKVGGDGEADIIFNNDGSVDIENGGDTQHYDSCNDLNKGCS